MPNRTNQALEGRSLRASLILPFLAVGVVATACMMAALLALTIVTDERVADHEVRETSEAVVERLASAVLANEGLARAAAAAPDLARLADAGDGRAIGEVLAPMAEAAEMEAFAVYAGGRGDPVYTRAFSDLDGDVAPLVEAARAGRAESALEVVEEGLSVVSASPIAGSSGWGGVLLAGRVVGGEEIRGEAEGDYDVHIALFERGKLAHTTAAEPALLDILRRPGLIERFDRSVNRELARYGWVGMPSHVEEGADVELLVVISIRHLQQASVSRAAGIGILALALLVTMLLTGMGVARRARRQLTATTQVAEMMADGNYDQRVPHGDIKELNLLAATINALGVQLQDHVNRLSRQAFYDHLTGLPNRALFVDRLAHAQKASARRKAMVAVLFMDLDNFKVVNDSLGHRAGDRLLVSVAERLEGCVRAGDTVARLGGDEFTVLLEDISGEAAATSTAERIQERLKAPFLVEDREVFVSASIGIVIARNGKPGIDDLLRDADLAMYRAKARGRACYEVFDQSLNDQAQRRLDLEGEMRRAIDAGEFELHYQPVMSLESGAVTGVEALVRWQHPTRGLLLPDEFIALAEETGLIIPIGRLVLREACRQIKSWQEQFPMWPRLTVSVNVSGRQIQDSGLVEDVAQALRETELTPNSLILEITESVLMESKERVRSTLVRLKTLGVQIAIDDFGTGYSSLAYLKHFPVDVLKIDRSFVGALGQKSEDGAIVRTIVELAKTLGLVVTGEGIETEVQLTSLLAVSCDEGQGYYFARPAPAEATTAMLGAACLPENIVPIKGKQTNRG